MPPLVYIYELIDPRDGQVRYIGKTVDLKKRLSSHIRDMDPSSAKVEWINSLTENGFYPLLRVIETCDENNWAERERFHIMKAVNVYGDKILNKAGKLPYAQSYTRLTINKKNKNQKRMKTGQVIREIRHKRFPGVSVTRFSQDILGMHVTTFSQIENGRPEKPEIRVLIKIAKALEVPFVAILLKAVEESDLPESKKHLVADMNRLGDEVIEGLTA